MVSAMAVVLSSVPAKAGSFSVSPLRIDFSSVAKTGALTVRSQQDGDVMLEVQVMLWEQVDGKDRLTPTRDVLVSPVVFSLPPNGSQLVRVALQRPVDPQRELSYRLILAEVPPQVQQGFTGLNVALRMSLPIFVAAIAATEPAIEWTAMRRPGGALDVVARNSGNAHARVLNFSVAPIADTDEPVREQVAAYILPDQVRTWTLDIPQKDGSSGTDWRRLRVKGASEAGDFELEISPGDG
jgi:fimbrial chaperone protein